MTIDLSPEAVARAKKAAALNVASNDWTAAIAAGLGVRRNTDDEKVAESTLEPADD